jgi:Zn-dependent M28 family amino/carboxypeptidase
MNADRRILSLLLVVAACNTPAPATPTPTPATGPLADIFMLASPAFGGREHGTPGNDSAAVFLARRYEALRLRPAFRQGCDTQGRCSASYFQWFNTPDGASHNVGAIVEGRDSLLRTEYVVIGAHFDHLGYSPVHSLDGYNGAVLRPGADDNASGTAALLALAERLGREPARRSILILDFDAEEEGMWGSHAFIASTAFLIGDMRFMLNLDMIGRLRDHHLDVQGVPERSAMRARIDSVARAAGLQAHFVRDQGRSDHASFAEARIPIAMFTTGEHADYHTSRDVASRINGPGLLAIIDVAESIVRSAADE